jgi:hypothetical protein
VETYREEIQGLRYKPKNNKMMTRKRRKIVVEMKRRIREDNFDYSFN